MRGVGKRGVVRRGADVLGAEEKAAAAKKAEKNEIAAMIEAVTEGQNL